VTEPGQFCFTVLCVFFELYLWCVFSCTVLFVSISQVIGCENRLRNDLDCVRSGVKLYSNSNRLTALFTWAFYSMFDCTD